MGQSRKIVFYLILTKFCRLSARQYESFVSEKILKSNWFKVLCRDKNVKVSYLSKNFKHSNKGSLYCSISDGKISFFNKAHIIIFDNINTKENCRFKLINVNIKNKTTFKLVNLLCKLQVKFLKTLHFSDLIFFDRNEIVKLFGESFNNSYIDMSLISRIAANTTIEIEGNKYLLSILLPKKTFLISLLIKDIFYSHEQKILTDEVIAKKLNCEHGFSLNRKNIHYIRKKYFIPSGRAFFETNECVLSRKSLSLKFVLSKENLKKIPNNTKAIYELCVDFELDYPATKSCTIYIGSSKNLRERLQAYLSGFAHTSKMRNFLESHLVYYRYLNTSNYLAYEKKFLECFGVISGSLPKLNHQKLANSSHKCNSESHWR